MLKKRATQFLRLALGVAIVAYLLRRAPLHEIADALRETAQQPLWLSAGLLLTFLGLLMGSIRWHVVLEAQGLRLSSWRVFKVFYIGQFFNAFMPGACGGDVARAFYAAQDFPEKRTEAASTVFVDRAIGLFAVIAWCCGVIALRLPFFLSGPATKRPGLLMLFFLATAVLGILALFRRNLFEQFPLFRRLEQAQPLGRLIRRSYEAFYVYRRRPGVMAAALSLSLLNLLFLTMACLCFGNALSISIPHPILNHLTMFPIITTLAAVPLTPGALGLREGLFAGLYGTLGVSTVAAVSLSLLVYAGGLFWSLLGGLFFINHTAERHRAVREELEILRDYPAQEQE